MSLASSCLFFLRHGSDLSGACSSCAYPCKVLCWLHVISAHKWGHWQQLATALAPCWFPRRSVESKGMDLLIFKKRIVYCALYCHLQQTFDKQILSAVPTPLRRLDTAIQHLSPVGNGDWPCQKQVRTRSRERSPSATTHHPPSAGQTTSMHEDR